MRISHHACHRNIIGADHAATLKIVDNRDDLGGLAHPRRHEQERQGTKRHQSQAHTDQGATSAGQCPNRLRRRRHWHSCVAASRWLWPIARDRARGRARHHRVVALPYVVGRSSQVKTSWAATQHAASGGEHQRRARAPNATMIGPTGGHRHATILGDRTGPIMGRYSTPVHQWSPPKFAHTFRGHRAHF